MENKQASPQSGKNTSKELLRVTGDGSQRAVIESIFKKSPKKQGDGPRTFKIARSPLLDQLQTFLPEFQKANTNLLDQPKEKIDAMNIESTDNDSKVVEMNLLMHDLPSGSSDESDEDTEPTEQMDDSDSDNDTPLLGPVTAENLKVPNEAKEGNKKGRNLIQMLPDVESERSDSEMTEASTSSAER